jgi:hypothetical protein
MLRRERMKSIDAQFVQKDDILIRDGTIVRILIAEWPYAVIRVYENGQFGRRRVTKLDGSYYVPSRDFLREIGVYESELLGSETGVECAVALKELLESSRPLEGALKQPDQPAHRARDQGDDDGPEYFAFDPR